MKKRKRPPIPIVILEASDAVDALISLRIAIRMDKLHRQIAQRPYPSGPMIMQMVSEAFPEMPQRHVYNCVQHIKGYIAQHEAIAALQKQNPTRN